MPVKFARIIKIQKNTRKVKPCGFDFSIEIGKQDEVPTVILLMVAHRVKRRLFGVVRGFPLPLTSSP